MPSSVSQDELNALPLDQLVSRGVNFRAVPLGEGEGGTYPSHIEVNAATLKVNQGLADGVFQLAFPDGLQVYNGFGVSRADIAKPKSEKPTEIPPEPGPSVIQWLFISVNVILLLTIAVRFAVKKRA